MRETNILGTMISGRRTLSRTTAALATLALAATVGLAGCGGDAGDEGGTAGSSAELIVERSTTDGIETVRNVSGSRWGNDARLEEELSIGEEVGDKAYLFGAITDAWATDDYIYVVDSQVPAVRAFDHQGNYLFDVGRTGQGPGEYGQPMALAVDGDGRVIVTDIAGARMNIYDAEGNSLESWALGSPTAAMGLVMADDGEMYTRMMDMPDNMEFGGTIELRWGMQTVGPDGLAGEPSYPPPNDYEPPSTVVEGNGNRFEMAIVPFTPSYEWAFTPTREFVAGVGNEYRFEILGSDGSTKVVEKTWEPTPVENGEAAFRSKLASQQVSQMAPDFRLDPSEVPAHKPAFTGFRPDRSGRIWVERQGPGWQDPNCTEVGAGTQMTMMLSSEGGTNVSIGGGPGGGDSDFGDDECWSDASLYDVFEIATGEFLGTVQAPEPGFRAPLFVEGDTVLASVQDEMGIARLKKYRLVIDS